MKYAATNFRLPALISTGVVFPLMILEQVNRRNLFDGFPFVLFGFLWLLAFAFAAIAMTLVRSGERQNGLTGSSVRLFSSVALLMLIGWLLTAIILDQMPCFLGVPNCD